jgi:hypothetical protein
MLFHHLQPKSRLQTFDRAGDFPRVQHSYQPIDRLLQIAGMSRLDVIRDDDAGLLDRLDGDFISGFPAYRPLQLSSIMPTDQPC